MSFATDVKNELIEVSDRSKQDILLYGVLYGMRGSELPVLYSENQAVIEYVKKLLSGEKYEVTSSFKRNAVQYALTVTHCEALSERFNFRSPAVNKEYVDGNDVDTGLFLRGVFLACGSISDPNREYHLELTLSTEEKCNAVFSLINEQGMSIKKSSRGGQAFLYAKESERISDFLTYIGAMIHSMEIMNVKIYKDVRNNVNRAVNCEAANIGKTVAAAQKQVEDIELIAERSGLNSLSEDLRQVAEMRLENRDMSLREIGEMLNPPISRSGVNHRLERISKIADSLRNKE
ncbi:MAG: DNA-binding protein WhiA [Ruminiclostridium sp.]